MRQSDTGAGEVVTLTYDNANQLESSQSSVHGVTTYTHDAAGNVTQKDDGVSVSYYTYDDRGQMALAEVPAGVVTMTYNALGQRIQKLSTDATETNYLYDGKKLLQESDDNGDATHTYTSTMGTRVSSEWITLDCGRGDGDWWAAQSHDARWCMCGEEMANPRLGLNGWAPMLICPLEHAKMLAKRL